MHKSSTLKVYAWFYQPYVYMYLDVVDQIRADDDDDDFTNKV